MNVFCVVRQPWSNHSTCNEKPEAFTTDKRLARKELELDAVICNKQLKHAETGKNHHNIVTDSRRLMTVQRG